MNNFMDKSGVIPYVFDNGVLWVLLVTPTNPNFGGPNPQICKVCIETLDVCGVDTAVKELKEETGINIKNYDLIYGKCYNLQKKILNSFYLDYKLYIHYVELKEKILHPLTETDGEVIPNWYRIPTALKVIRKDQKHILIDFISCLI